jgi:hypothetical protein
MLFENFHTFGGILDANGTRTLNLDVCISYVNKFTTWVIYDSIHMLSTCTDGI